MSFLVVWSELAFDQMSIIISDSPYRRSEFAATLKRISSTLRDDPESNGESREGKDRIWFVNDLVVTFAVDDESHAVEIASIRQVLKRK